MNARLKRFIAAVVLLAGGVVFIAMGARSLKEVDRFPKTEAVVARVEREWVPDSDGGDTEEISIFVTYTVDGKEYTERLNNTKTNLSEGDRITVHYDPDDPASVSGATKGMAAVYIVIGCALALGGAGSAVFALIRP